MRAATLLALLICAVLLSAPAAAGVISRDWLAPGDGLLTYDDVNQREWLDLSQTLLEQFPGATIEDRYQSVVAELVEGELFEGFSVAVRGDVSDLARSAGIDIDTMSYAINEEATRELIALLSVSVQTGLGVATYGTLDELAQISTNDRLIAGFAVVSAIQEAGFGTFALSEFNDDRPARIVGVYLYRDIPEPSPDILLLIGLPLITLLNSKGRA